MTESILIIYSIVSTLANLVFFYLFWAAIRENRRLNEAYSELIVENARLIERVYSK